jgi:folate-dependent phosphoribosylglycinamide formyltransferase PurN
MVEKLRIGVLASGGGTDLQSIIDASESGIIDAEVVVVIKDQKNIELMHVLLTQREKIEYHMKKKSILFLMRMQ